MGLFNFFTQEIAIDLGTANTLIIHNDKVVVDEPSIVAFDRTSVPAPTFVRTTFAAPVAPRLDDVALPELRALLAEAVFSGGGDARPNRRLDERDLRTLHARARRADHHARDLLHPEGAGASPRPPPGVPYDGLTA